MKKLIAILIVAVFIVSVTAIAADYPRIRVDGEFVYIYADDQPPVIVDGRTLVPLRAVMEALGFRVEWEQPPLNRARLTKPDFSITVTIGRDTMSVNSESIPLDVPAQIMNNRTMVPLRAISEATGMVVEWDEHYRIADIWTTSYARTRSSITLTNERISEQKLTEWIAEYRALGGANDFELEVVRLVNVERANYGLQPLEIYEPLMMAARFKSQEMVDLGYFGHDSPVYGSFQWIPSLFGVLARSENLASGHGNPQRVVNGWMNSPAGHGVNIVGENDTIIGIGRVGGLTTLMVGTN
ncbi:MAG: stalk domain-containing protein [Oscillospiraceae bacterium]|nr:stalk domain-containing protein [Oscillospiraceae bacterium]